MDLAKHLKDTYNNGYQGMQTGLTGAVNTPREIGIIDRVQGINGGLIELYGRLESVLSRFDGSGLAAGASKNTPPPAGLLGTMNEAETTLRGCIELAGQINAKL